MYASRYTWRTPLSKPGIQYLIDGWCSWQAKQDNIEQEENSAVQLRPI